MAPRRKGLTTLLGLLSQATALNFNYGSFGPNDKLLIFDRKFCSDVKVEAALWNVEATPTLSNLIQLDCNVLEQRTFENSDEFLPLTAAGYHYLECSIEAANYEHLTTYALALRLNNGETKY